MAVVIFYEATIFVGRKLEAKIISRLYVHCHAHRLDSACYYTAADLYSMVYETAKALSMQLWKCFTFCRCDQLAWRYSNSL